MYACVYVCMCVCVCVVIFILILILIYITTTTTSYTMTNYRYLAIEQSEIEIALEVESMVLLNMLLSFKPSLQEELIGDEDDIKPVVGGGGGSAASAVSIEVVWRGELQRRFFHTPDICDHISNATKAQFVEAVERDSQESKLLALYTISAKIYR